MTSLLNLRENVMFPINEQFNRLFDRLTNELAGSDSLHSIRSKGRSGYPKLDVLETDKEYVVEVEVPGINPDDLTVEVLPASDNGKTLVVDSLAGMDNIKVLRISGKKDYDYQYGDKTTWHIKEMRRSQFVRELILPSHFADDPAAKYERGILRLTWPKPEPQKAPEPKRIEITKA